MNISNTLELIKSSELYSPMPSVRIHKKFNKSAYFLTFTIKQWYYLFDRHNRWQILLDSLKYCQIHKDLKIYGWVFMLNHIHLIVRSEDMIGFVRDFKSYTSKQLKRNVKATEPHLIQLFEQNGSCGFWMRSNIPILIETEKFYVQKKRYIEFNPVKKSYVKFPEDWFYSSANQDTLLELETPE